MKENLIRRAQNRMILIQSKIPHLISSSKDLLHKLIVAQLAKKRPASYGT
jgi:hypothetical protein